MKERKSKSERELIAKLKFIEQHGLETPKNNFFKRYPIIEGIFYYIGGSIFLTGVILLLAKCVG